MTNETTIALVDYGDVALTNETMDIVTAVFEEVDFSTDNVDYYHLSNRRQLDQIKTGYDVVLAMGADALKPLCKTDQPLKKYAGCLTWNSDLDSWVLPTTHPNRIYQGFYGDFDIAYDHIRRAIDLCRGTLKFPPVDGHRIDWEYIGHNGNRGGYPGDSRVWSGYFERTAGEVERARQVLKKWLRQLDQGVVKMGLDTESFTTDHFQPLTMIQVFIDNKGWAFNWGVVNDQSVKHLMRKFLRHRNARFVLHNTKHDRKMLKHWLDVDLGDRDEDTMCWALGLTEKGIQTGLKYLARQYCNAPFYEEGLEEWLDTDKSKINYGHIRPDVLAEYGCLDVYYTLELAQILPLLVDREGTTSLVRNILLPAARTFADIEYPGILVDQEYAQVLQGEWEPLIDKAIIKVQDFAREAGFPQDPKYTKSQIDRRICDCVPLRLREALDGLRCLSYGKTLRVQHDFNPPCEMCSRKRYVRHVDTTINVRSNPQMQHLCFDVLGMEETYEGRKTNKYFWEINPAHPFTQLVKAYRELDYLNRNIIEGFSKFIRADGRIHPDFLLFGTVTGRLAVRNPGMQTVPARSDNGKLVKKLFLPDPGDLCVNVDYSNLELYMAHHLTGDDVLLEALQKDMHKTTAAAMYMKAYEEVTVEERQSAKPVNFGAGYNIGPGKLARDINLIQITNGEKSKAKRFLDEFWGLYTKWDRARKSWITEAMDNCELMTELGRKRRWSLITKDNIWKVENQACNFRGQSMASDLCLTSLIKLHKELTARGWGRVLLSVHDSIVFSIHKENIHEAVELIIAVMTTPVFETSTPFKVDVTLGKSYGDQEEYDKEKSYV